MSWNWRAWLIAKLTEGDQSFSGKKARFYRALGQEEVGTVVLLCSEVLLEQLGRDPDVNAPAARKHAPVLGALIDELSSQPQGWRTLAFLCSSALDRVLHDHIRL